MPHLPYNILPFSSLVYCKNIIYSTYKYKICVNGLSTLSVRLPVKSRLLDIFEEAKIIQGFSSAQGRVKPLTLMFSEAHLYIRKWCNDNTACSTVYCDDTVNYTL